jgi:hypothetical protein
VTAAELQDLPLDNEAREALELVVERDVEAVLDAVSGTADEPVFALALVYGDGQEELEPAAVHVGLDADRRAALAAPTREEAFERLWSVNCWQGGEVTPRRWPSDMRDFAAASALLNDVLDSHGVHPVRWVLARVARALTSRPPPVPTSAGFVVLPIDLAALEQVSDDVEFVGGADAVARLSKMLVLDPSERSRSVAQVVENLDEDELRWLATFDCHVEGDEDQDEGEYEEGPAAASLSDALAWAEGHAQKIALTVGSTTYSAGRVALRGLPQWPRGESVMPRPISGQPRLWDGDLED